MRDDGGIGCSLGDCIIGISWNHNVVGIEKSQFCYMDSCKFPTLFLQMKKQNVVIYFKSYFIVFCYQNWSYSCFAGWMTGIAFVTTSKWHFQSHGKNNYCLQRKCFNWVGLWTRSSENRKAPYITKFQGEVGDPSTLVCGQQEGSTCSWSL